MSIAEKINEEVKNMPDEDQRQILDFTMFLKMRKQREGKIKREKEDRFRYRSEPEMWGKIDLAMAKKRLEHPGVQLELLVIKATEGSVSANKELDKRLDKLRMRDAHEARAPMPGKLAKAKAPKLGKKAEQKVAAEGVRGKFEPRLPPRQLVN